MDRPLLSVRQMVEGMTLAFNPEAAGDREAVIQFQVSDPDGEYYLQVKGGDCTFHPGRASSPDLTIITPAEVWQKISREELSGQDALTEGLYRIDGDLNLLLNFSKWFDQEHKKVKAGPEQRPGGPLPLSGMAWLQVAFVPWMIFWSLFESGSPEFSVLVSLCLALAIVVYRLVFDKPTFFEWGTCVFFLAAGLMVYAHNSWFRNWSSIVSSLVVGGLWFGSVVFRKLPLCGEYSKWAFVERLWRTTLFIHPNAVISLVWGWQFVAAAFLGMAAMEFKSLSTGLTVLRFALMIPAAVFTVRYQKGSEKRYIEDMDGTLDRLRSRAWEGMIVTALMTVASFFLPVH